MIPATSSRRRQRSPFLRAILVLIAIGIGPALLSQTLSGTFRHLKDSDGRVPKTGAEITLTFSPGTFKMKAVMPGETMTDAGTWKITGGNMTISFKELEQGTKSGPWSLNNGTLTLPFKMLADGAGSSTWQQLGVAIIPTGTVEEVIKRNMEGVKKITKYTDKLDSWAATRAKNYKGGLAESYYVQALRFYFRNLRPESLYGFAKAASLQPGNALYLHNLSTLIMQYDKYSDAVILLKEVTKQFPNLASPWGNLALAQMKLQNFKAADSAIRIARRLDPTNGMYCYTDGKIKEEQGKKKEAQVDYDKAWELGYAGKGREGAKSANGNVVKNNPKGNPKNNPNPVKNPAKTKGEEERDKLAQWEGHYEASVVSARSGETAQESNTTFGKDLAQTNINLKTLACAKEFSMDISKSGNITGSGKILYVYQGAAGGPVTGMAPAPITAMNGGFAANLKDGFQLRDWRFSGTVDADGNVEINGMPTEEMDLLNVGKWQKIKPWSALPPDGPGSAMKGPFHMKLVNDDKMGPVIKVDQFLELGDKLIRKVHYRAYIFRTDDDVQPDCQSLGKDPEQKCPASEFIKTKVAYSPAEHISIEQSTTYTKSGEPQHEMAVNFSAEAEFAGMGTASVEYHQDNSFEMTIGVGVNTDKLAKGSPLSLSEKLELVYDSKCGWGVKASASVKLDGGVSNTSASVEGVIFFNKAL